MDKCIACKKELDSIPSARMWLMAHLSLGRENAPAEGESSETYTLCEDCASRLLKNLSRMQDSIEAMLSDRLYILPVALPKVGDSVYEVIAYDAPIVESVIYKINGSKFMAKSKNRGFDSGEIEFTPLDLTDDIHDTERCLFLKKDLARKNKSWRFNAKREAETA